MHEYPQQFEPHVLYRLVDGLYGQYPLVHWFCLIVLIGVLLGLLFLPQAHIKRFPKYGYMLAVVCSLGMIDIFTQMIPMLTVYLIVLGNVLVRTNGENVRWVTATYAGVYLLIDVSTYWHQYMVLDLMNQTLLFIWISWVTLQLQRSFTEISKMKEKSKHFISRMKEMQLRLKEYNEEIEETYRRDYLTGLYNLGGFQERIRRGIARCGNNQSYHIICIDLTDFKQVNTREGIEVGDQLLIDLARLLKRYLPVHAHIARYDGDQFAIGVIGDAKLLTSCLEIVERVMEELRAGRTMINYCLGFASYPADTDNADDLLRLAEHRLSIQQRRVRDEEEERRRHLEKLSAVGQLAAGLAHEIRNPLTSIRGFVQISAAESEAVKKWESIIIPEIDRINDLLNQFLKLSESRPAKFTQFRLDQLVHDVIRLLQPKAILLGHEIKVAAPIEAVTIEADAEQIKQVFINLIQNGLDSLKEKGKVEIFWKEEKDRVKIEIKDTGVGIKPEDMGRIFEPFFTTKDDGTGMGLPICYRIIDDHGGNIFVTSSPMRGTTFTIHLPLRQSMSGVHLLDQEGKKLIKRKMEPAQAIFQKAKMASSFVQQETNVR